MLAVHLLPTGANTSLAARQFSGSWRLLGNTGVPSCACAYSTVRLRRIAELEEARKAFSAQDAYHSWRCIAESAFVSRMNR